MKVEITVRGRRQMVDAGGADGDPVRLEPVAGAECWRLIAGGGAVLVRLRERDGGLLVTVGADRVEVGTRRPLPVPSRRAAAHDGGGRIEVRAPMPGLVVSVPAAAGEPVADGSVVAIVEAMKMQMEVAAPAPGRIEEIRVRPGQEVAAGQVLVLVRTAGPAGHDARQETGRDTGQEAGR